MYQCSFPWEGTLLHRAPPSLPLQWAEEPTPSFSHSTPWVEPNSVMMVVAVRATTTPKTPIQKYFTHFCGLVVLVLFTRDTSHVGLFFLTFCFASSLFFCWYLFRYLLMHPVAFPPMIDMMVVMIEMRCDGMSHEMMDGMMVVGMMIRMDGSKNEMGMVMMMMMMRE